MIGTHTKSCFVDGFEVVFPLATGSVALRAGVRLFKLAGPIFQKVASAKLEGPTNENALIEGLRLASENFSDADLDYFEKAYLESCTVNNVLYKQACGQGGLLTGKPLTALKILIQAFKENNADFFQGLTALNPNGAGSPALK